MSEALEGPTSTGSPPTPAPSVGRSVGRMAAGTGVSRLLGLVREQMFAASLGASAWSDAFLVAFRIPGLLRSVFAEGALATAFIPTFSAHLETEGRPAAMNLANLVMTSLSVVLGGLVVLGMLLPEQFIGVLAPGFGPDKASLAASAARILLPFLLIISLATVCMGMLSAQERYTRATLGPAMFNVVSIVGGMVLIALDTPVRTAVLGWAVITLTGGVAQLVFQVIPLWRMGFRPRVRLDLRLRDPGHRRVAKLLTAALLGVVATQANLVIITVFASSAERSISYLSYAFRLVALPLGLLGVATGVVTAVTSSRAVARGDQEGLRTSVHNGLRFLIAFTLPAMAGLIVLARPVVRLVFERGRFGAEDTEATALALALYSAGLLGYACVRVFSSAFYALSRPMVAVMGSLAAVGIQLTITFAAYGTYGFPALAVGASVGAIVNSSLLATCFHRSIGLLGRELGVLFGKVAVCSGAMAACAWMTAHWLEEQLPWTGLVRSLATAGIPTLVGLGVFAATCRWLGVREVLALWRRRR